MFGFQISERAKTRELSAMRSDSGDFQGNQGQGGRFGGGSRGIRSYSELRRCSGSPVLYKPHRNGKKRVRTPAKG